MAAKCGEVTLDEILAAADCQRDKWFLIEVSDAS